MGESGMPDAVGGMVDLFASFAQDLANRAVIHAAQRDYREYLKQDVVNTLLNPPTETEDQCILPGSINGVLLVIGVEEPRTIDLGLEPRWRRFLSIAVAGYGSDPVRVKQRYVSDTSPRLLAGPSSDSLQRVDYFVWMNLNQAMMW